MSTLTTRGFVLLAALVASSSALGSACYVQEGLPPPESVDGYEPQYYDGYVVYYDDAGRPFYYENGAVTWVPPTAPIYVGLVNHWRLHGHAYHAWYGHHGYRYRTYRGHRR